MTADERLSPRGVLVAEAVAAVRSRSVAVTVGALLALFAPLVTGLRHLDQGPVASNDVLALGSEVFREVTLVLVLAVCAVRQAGRIESGVDSALHLAGWPLWARLLPSAVDAGLVLVGAVLGLLGALLAGVGPEPAALSDASSGTGALLVRLTVATVPVAVIGAATGRWVGRRAGVLAVCAGAVPVGIALHLSGGLQPWLSHLAPLWPTRSATVLLATPTPTAWALGAGACLVWTLGGLVLLARSSVRSPGRVRRDPAGRAERSPRAGLPGRAGLLGGGPLRTRTAAGTAVAMAFGFGLVVPSALRPFVPWYLRPQWIAEVAAGTASPDVARAWLVAVQRGDLVAARKYATGDVAAVAGPFEPWLAELDPQAARVDRGENDRPEAVVLPRRPEVGGRLFVCLVRGEPGWLVRVIRSQPDCAVPTGVRS